jgi:hypothetical protein
MQICQDIPSSLVDRPWIAIACYLIEYGASLDQADARGNTPIARQRNPVVVEILQKHARFVSLILWKLVQKTVLFKMHVKGNHRSETAQVDLLLNMLSRLCGR